MVSGDCDNSVHIRIFNPTALSCRDLPLTTCYRHHEGAYEQRVREVENGSYTPLVFSTSGGMERAATVAYKRLATLLAVKRDQPYSVVMVDVIFVFHYFVPQSCA